MTIPEHIWLPIAIVVSVIAALAFWWWWPKWQVNRLAPEIRDPKARADVEDNFRRTVGQLLGGAAVLFGAWLAFLQFSQQQQTAQSEIKQQQQAARDLLISNQVSKGFEQLASDKTAMRLGGIYALEGVMNASERPEQYRGPVLEVLCAFVREYTIGKTVFEKPAIDIQAALTVIGRRKGQELPDLAKANIPGANLSGANLSGADLDGAHLNSAYLSGANLSGANLLGANLSGASLTGAKLSRVDLTGADLTGANLGLADLNGAYLSSANLSGANLSGANLRGADLSGANLRSANLRDANFSVAYLIRADLTGAKNLTQTQLNEACGNNETRLPEGLSLKPCPPITIPPQAPQVRGRRCDAAEACAPGQGPPPTMSPIQQLSPAPDKR
jgi:uncharacterized protein YjbI with pentapeptide repeats